jgi:hypothetical protein
MGVGNDMSQVTRMGKAPTNPRSALLSQIAICRQ